MYTNRCYWVDWICVFNQKPSAKDLGSFMKKMKLYLENYLKGLRSKATKGIGGVNTTVFAEEVKLWNRSKLTWETPSTPEAIKKTRDILTKREQIGKNKWIDMLKWEWDQLSSEQELVFNFKAYFENNSKRYTLETKGTMTPPPPPPPPGAVPS